MDWSSVPGTRIPIKTGTLQNEQQYKLALNNKSSLNFKVSLFFNLHLPKSVVNLIMLQTNVSLLNFSTIQKPTLKVFHKWLMTVYSRSGSNSILDPYSMAFQIRIRIHHILGQIRIRRKNEYGTDPKHMKCIKTQQVLENTSRLLLHFLCSVIVVKQNCQTVTKSLLRF